MPVIKSFAGLYGYKDEECVSDVIHYPFDVKKGYQNDFSNEDYRNLLFTDADDKEFDVALEGVVEQFQAVQKLNTRAKIKMNHFVVSFKELGYVSDETLSTMKNTILNYVARKWFCQVFCVVQYEENNPHIHFVMNHINMFGGTFLANYGYFWELVNYLNEATNMKWSYCPGSSLDYCR